MATSTRVIRTVMKPDTPMMTLTPTIAITSMIGIMTITVIILTVLLTIKQQ